MKVQCENCNTALNLPDDKLQPGMDFAFACPKCKHKNTIKVPEDLGAEASGTPAAPPGSPDEDVFSSEDVVGAGDFFEEGAKPAMICFDDAGLRDQLAGIAKDLGYVPVKVQSARDALKRLRLTQYRLVLLEETFDGATLESNTVYRFLKPMDMTTRRRMFVGLFGDGFQSLDQMGAFAMSVNALVNKNDRDQFDKVLHRAISEYERFYKVFFDVMRETGKI